MAIRSFHCQNRPGSQGMCLFPLLNRELGDLSGR